MQGSNHHRDRHGAWDPSPYEFNRHISTHAARPARRHSLMPGATSTSASAMAAAAAMHAWKNSAHHAIHHHNRSTTDEDGANTDESPLAYPRRTTQHSDALRAPEATTTAGMKFLLRPGQQQTRKNSGQSPYPHPNGLLKVVPPITGFDLRNNTKPLTRETQYGHLVELPEGTLHVWVYQARHLVFRRLFETMYERHGLRLRVYAGSRATQDVGEIYETRRNYGGNMANPRWRRDQDDARDNTHGHFSIPLSRASLRRDTELIVEIVCGILVVASTTISLPSLFLGSFGTDLASLATCNMQFRPHWFPLAGDESGLIEMSLEFIPTKLRRLAEQNQPQHTVATNTNTNNQQPESEFDADEDQAEEHDTSPYLHDHYHLHIPRTTTTQRSRSASNSPEMLREAERDRQRAREYEAMERQEQLRRQRFEVLEDRHGRGTTSSSSHSTTSSHSTPPRFVMPRRSSLSDIESRSYGQEEYLNQDEMVIMDAYETSPRGSEFSGYEHHDSRYIESSGFDEHSSLCSDFDELSMSASLSSVSTLNDSTATQENLLNKQLWDLYRYGISDEAPEEIMTYSVSPRSSMVSISSSVLSRKMSTMSQASNYSIAFSDASEASMMSREASTCASEILTYNDRIQRMEEAIRAAQDRRLAEEATTKAAAAISTPSPPPPPSPSPPPQPQQVVDEPRRKQHLPPSIVTSNNNGPAPRQPPAPLTPYGWERPQPLAQPSPASASEPVILESRKGVVLFDLDDIPVTGQAGQTDPALAAYRAKMLARRRSLPIHMLSGGGVHGLQGAIHGQPHGYPPPLVRDGRLMRINSQPRHSMTTTDSMGCWSTRTLQVSAPRPAVVDAPVRIHYPPPRSPHNNDVDDHHGRRSDAARSAKSDETNPPRLPVVSGPSSLRRKRSSSMHSISDLLRDQSFRIHNIATEPTPSSSRPSIGDQRSTISDRRLSKASSSDASSTGPQVVPTGNASSAAPRVRRNSKGGGTVVQIHGIALGVGKFINVGNVPGVIRYIGPTMFAPGQWIGIELVEKKGKHNGTVQNVQYFECAPDHGIFIRAERLDISM